MAICANCNSIIVGGKKVGKRRYCNDACVEAGSFRADMDTIPADILEPMVDQAYRQDCPKCHKPGPVDIHKSYMIYSVVIFTRWSTKPQVCCKSCALKSQAGAVLFSSLCGWWGIPFGILGTPFVLIANFVSMIKSGTGKVPSKALRELVSANLVQAQRDLQARDAALGPLSRQISA